MPSKRARSRRPTTRKPTRPASQRDRAQRNAKTTPRRFPPVPSAQDLLIERDRAAYKALRAVATREPQKVRSLLRGFPNVLSDLSLPPWQGRGRPRDSFRVLSKRDRKDFLIWRARALGLNNAQICRDLGRKCNSAARRRFLDIHSWWPRAQHGQHGSCDLVHVGAGLRQSANRSPGLPHRKVRTTGRSIHRAEARLTPCRVVTPWLLRSHLLPRSASTSFTNEARPSAHQQDERRRCDRSINPQERRIVSASSRDIPSCLSA
jgi:hypothetical protein